MEEGKIEGLIAYLASLEFKGERLEQEVRKNIALGLPFFSVLHKKDYGSEQMFYDLRFRKDRQFDAYRWEGFKATHRNPIKIEHAVINGIDTESLEKQMKEIDWAAHFIRSEKYPENRQDSGIAKVVSDLLELDANQNFDGIKIQELLQLKYFPEQAYDDRLKELCSIYDRSRNFTTTENGLCNAHLAYHIISGRLHDLNERLQCLELEKYPGIDIHAKLESILSGNPDTFEIKCFRNEPEGYAEYIVPVTQINGRYSADTYTVSLTPYPPIEHDLYSEIDTRDLESKMQKIDWHNDRELFILHEDREPEFLPKVGDIQEQMYRLSQDMVGSDIADKLQLKYWADASFFEDMVQQSAWDYLDSLPKREQQFPVEMKAKTAFNLLCGRAAWVSMPLPVQPDKNIDTWVRIDLTNKTEYGSHRIEIIESFPIEMLEERLKMLPIEVRDFYSIKSNLKRGDLVPMAISEDRKILLESNPEDQTINIYTTDLRPIYANLTLDPDWRPNIPTAEKVQEISPKNLPSAKQSPFHTSYKKQHQKGRRI